MTTRSEAAGKISWRQAVVSSLVLGTLLAVSFGGGVLKQGQRYRFLGQELYAGTLEGERYRLLQEYHFINNYQEPRRLFVCEGTGHLAPRSRLILTDENYAPITRLEFPMSGECRVISLVRTVNPPLLEMVSFTGQEPECRHFTISEDHFVRFLPSGDFYQTASLGRSTEERNRERSPLHLVGPYLE